MSIATDVRTYADTALAQGKAALSNAGTAAVLINKRLIADAPKPALAALGAADLVASAVTRRVEALPAEAADGVNKVQQGGRTLLNRTQDQAVSRLSELRGRLNAGRDAASTLPVVARNATEAYLSTAKELYGKLTVRGEAKAAELRNGRLFGQLADSVESTVPPVLKSAFDNVQSVSPVETKPAGKPAAAQSTRKAAAAGSTQRKAAAAKSTATKSTATKSTAAKSNATGTK